MTGTRVALLVGCTAYDNPTLTPLPARQNVDALAGVLADPAIGDFRIETLLDQPSATVAERIEGFFAGSRRGDFLLLYFSCHGVLDPNGLLYFATANTKDKLLDATGISAQRVQQWMNNSRSKRIVLLLDCCYSGSFWGVTRGGADTEEVLQRQLDGHGRAVITASGRLECAHDSVFTDAVVAGLQTGDADRDGDGLVSVHELYQYAHDQVRTKRPGQTPMWSTSGSGELYLAKNPHKPLPLPDDLDQALRSSTVWQRRGAIYGLELLLAGDHPGGQKRTARQELLRLQDGDTDPAVRATAKEVLNKIYQPSDVARNVRSGHWLVKASVAAVVALVSLAAVAWDSSSDTEPAPCTPIAKGADGVLSLGTLLPRTGQYIYTGPAIDAGVHLAYKDIKDVGGIPGLAVTLDPANQRDEGNSFDETAAQSIDALLTGGVDVVIGPSTSAVAGKVIDEVVCAGVIMFAPSNTSPMFTTWPDHGLYFRTMPPSDVEADVLGKLVVKDGNSTVVVMSRNDAYAHPLRENIVKAIHESGGQVLDSFHYNQDSLDVQRVVQRVKDKNPDAIVVIGFAESARILDVMIEEGLGPKTKRVYSDSGNLSNTLAGQVNPQEPGVLAGMRGTLPQDGGEEFVKRLREVNGGLQDVAYAAQSYDAVVITVLAAAVARTDGPALVAKEINGVTKAGEKCTSFAACMTLVKDGKDIDYDGPSGPLEFTDPGEPTSTAYVINEIQPDGTVKPLGS